MVSNLVLSVVYFWWYWYRLPDVWYCDIPSSYTSNHMGMQQLVVNLTLEVWEACINWISYTFIYTFVCVSTSGIRCNKWIWLNVHLQRAGVSLAAEDIGIFLFFPLTYIFQVFDCEPFASWSAVHLLKPSYSICSNIGQRALKVNKSCT